MNRFCLNRSRSGAMLLLALTAVLLGGCNYTGVGNLTITEQAVDSKSQSSDITGTFDRYLSREDGDVFTFTAYQKLANREKFGQYHRTYKKDPQFVQAELIVRINKAGVVIGEPRLLLRQGSRILTDGPLQGDVTVESNGNQLLITGDGLNWRFDDSTSHAVSFVLTVHNVLTQKPVPVQTQT